MRNFTTLFFRRQMTQAIFGYQIFAMSSFRALVLRNLKIRVFYVFEICYYNIFFLLLQNNIYTRIFVICYFIFDSSSSIRDYIDFVCYIIIHFLKQEIHNLASFFLMLFLKNLVLHRRKQNYLLIRLSAKQLVKSIIFH